jgi:beta-lactamase class A
MKSTFAARIYILGELTIMHDFGIRGAPRGCSKTVAAAAGFLMLWWGLGGQRSGHVAAGEPAKGGSHNLETGESQTLESRLLPLIRAHQGKVAVVVKHLGTGESFSYHEADVMPTASLIKFPVMVEAYRQAAAGKVDLNSVVVLKQQDKVPGSGILTSHFSSGARFSLRDAVRLMIVFSDNTATNLVLDSIGIGATAATMESLGYPHTKIHSKVFRRDTSVFPERSKQFGLGSTTAAEMVRLCEALHRKQLVSPKACDEMLDHLRACDDRDKFPRLLPPGTKVAFKTGSLAETRTAAGIIEWPGGPVALCVMSSENEDKRWVPDNAGNRLCAEIARAVYDHFDATHSEAKPATKSQAQPTER